MKVFCCGAPERDEKVEDELELDKDGHPKNLPYVEDGLLKQPEKMEFEKIEEVMQFSKFVANMKKIDFFDIVLEEHCQRFERIESMFSHSMKKHNK